MKNTFLLLNFLLLFSACEYLSPKLNLEKIKNPDQAIFKMYPNFELDRMYVEDLNYDGFLDYEIIGYDQYGNYIEAYFIHNGEGHETYTYKNSDDYWNDYDDYGDVYEQVEDYFYDMEDMSQIQDVFYADITEDGLDDAVAVSFYDSDDYLSIDIYIFLGAEGGYQYFGLSEMHYPNSEEEFDVYKTVTIDEEFFTVELEEEGKWLRHITFKYDEDSEDFILHKDGGELRDEKGTLIKNEYLTEDDFGFVYFYEFIPDEPQFFSLRIETHVSNTKELLAAIGNNRIIYLEEGDYLLNDLDALPSVAKRKFEESTGWSTFYSTDFYNYSGYGGSSQSEIILTLTHLRNTAFIGEGNVRWLVDDEYVTVLKLEDCDKLEFENIYMVHDVGGVCGANVVDMYYSDDIDFYECVFDGSGELGVFAEGCYSAYFSDCSFTNCSDGALDFYDSDGMFDYCIFSDNQIWFALVAAYGYSSLDFYECEFTDNTADAYNSSDKSYLFYADQDAYIYVDSYSFMEDNQVDMERNDRDNITLP